jgi:hypothetical protein
MTNATHVLRGALAQLDGSKLGTTRSATPDARRLADHAQLVDERRDRDYVSS